MSDLISRKTVIEALKKQDLEFMQQADLQQCIEDTISRVPTAYDVDSIEAELSELFVDIVTEGDATALHHWNEAVNKCIDIVKGAAKDE